MKLEYSKIKDLLTIREKMEDELNSKGIFDEIWVCDLLEDLFLYIGDLANDILPFDVTDKACLVSSFLPRNETLEDYIKDVEENSTEVEE